MPQWDLFLKALKRNSMPAMMNVLMLGSRGVGKTSLLTSMYEQLKFIVDATHLLLTPDEESGSVERLGECLAKLKEVSMNVTASGGLEGDQDFRDYVFKMGHVDRKPDMKLNFIDCPGGALASGAPADQRARLRELVNACEVVIIAIDGPALMERMVATRDKDGRTIKEEGRWNEEINKPFQITALFKNYYQDLTENRLVLLVPVKCEAYVKDINGVDNPGRATAMISKVKEGYKDLLSFLRTRGNVAIAITSVQTIGSVYFSHYDVLKEHGREIAVPRFFAPNPAVGYSPRDNEQPLRYLLRFFMREYHNARMSGPAGLLRYLTGRYDYLLTAANILQAGCKDQADPSRAFEIIQGDALL